MAAKALQQVTAAHEQLEQVDPAPGATGALAHSLVQADHEGGAGIFLTQAGGHDAHHPLVPFRVGQDDGPLLGLVVQALDALLKDLPLNVLPLPVELAQLLGQFLGPLGGVGKQQLPGQGRLAHAPGGVDAGGQGVSDGHRGEGPLPQPCLLNELGQTQPLGVGQGGQSGLDDGAVLPRHGHHVGHRTHSGQIGVVLKHLPRPLRSGHRHGQLQCHPHAGQPLEGVRAVGAVGVHHRHSGGQGVLALVVVGDHHVHPKSGGKPHFLHGGDAAVHGNDEGHPLVGQGLDGLQVEAVTFLQAVGNVGGHLSPHVPQAVGEQTGGGDAVHVVVSIDRQMLPRLQRPAYPRRRPVHIPQQHGVQHRLGPGGKQPPGLVGPGDAPGGQDGRQQGRDARRLQILAHPGAARGHLPLFVFHRRSPPPSLPQAYCGSITTYYTIFLCKDTSGKAHPAPGRSGSCPPKKNVIKYESYFGFFPALGREKRRTYDVLQRWTI